MAARTAIRHGDVILVPINTVPKQAVEKAKDNGKVVLAYGEVTGHSHQIVGNAMSYSFDDKVYLRINDTLATLRHEEHGDIPVYGDYEVIIQQDYEPSGWKKVID